MAKTKKEKSFEEALWDSCDNLRGSVEPAEYKHVVLSLIFLKFVSDKFERRKNEIIEEGHEKFVDQPSFYMSKNVFYLPEKSRWSYILDNAKQDDISIKIDTALSEIEKNNKSLKGALPDNYYSRLNLDKTKLASLLDEINKINTLKDEENDIIGRVYEFFLKKFALQEGKGKGEFYTPKSVVNLICELIKPYKGKIYDPACGSGGMFVQSMKFVDCHNGNRNDISIYGQEYIRTTYKLAKMNLAIRGISADLGEHEADTFLNDQHKDLKADYIMANPPFNQKKWRKEDQLVDDERWQGYDVPPTGNANYGWILNMISKLSCNGVAGFLLSNGSLTGSDAEYRIRRQIIENNLVEAIFSLPTNLFYTTDISVSLWIVNNNKKERFDDNYKYRNRENEVIFFDLRKFGSPYEKKYLELTEEDINKISTDFTNWRTIDGYQNYKDVNEYCRAVNIDEIRKNDYSLAPSRYIKLDDKISDSEFKEDVEEIITKLNSDLKDEKNNLQEVNKIFKEFGYELEI